MEAPLESTRYDCWTTTDDDDDDDDDDEWDSLVFAPCDEDSSNEVVNVFGFDDNDDDGDEALYSDVDLANPIDNYDIFFTWKL